MPANAVVPDKLINMAPTHWLYDSSVSGPKLMRFCTPPTYPVVPVMKDGPPSLFTRSFYTNWTKLLRFRGGNLLE